MTATVEVDGTNLRVSLSGASGKLALKSQLEIPIADVRVAKVETASEARSEQGAKDYWPVRGNFVPGLIREGTFGKGDDKEFWYLHEHTGPVLVVDLEHDEYARLVLQVAEPEKTASAINEACGGANG
ncbi:MAG: hypothetical protein HYX32_03085 [Actinobacteria bacterium]|nr:hypothetical protein [Actinomycetota bacterium]